MLDLNAAEILSEFHPNAPSSYAFEPLPMSIQHRILLIEDDLDQRNLFSLLLEHHGYSVTPTPSAKAGLELLNSNYFSCIVSDLKMPEMSGSELLTTLRTHSDFENIPIIILTSAPKYKQMRVLQDGADLFCDKRSAIHTLPMQVDLLLK